MEPKSHVRGRAYRCLHCERKGRVEVNSRSRLVDHVYKYHVPNDDQPFWCRLCLFHCTSKDALQDHVTTYARHKNVIKEKGLEDSTDYLVMNKVHHTVGDNDVQCLGKDESIMWWKSKEARDRGKDILADAVSLAVPEVYWAVKYNPVAENRIQDELDVDATDVQEWQDRETSVGVEQEQKINIEAEDLRVVRVMEESQMSVQVESLDLRVNVKRGKSDGQTIHEVETETEAKDGEKTLVEEEKASKKKVDEQGDGIELDLRVKVKKGLTGGEMLRVVESETAVKEARHDGELEQGVDATEQSTGSNGRKRRGEGRREVGRKRVRQSLKVYRRVPEESTADESSSESLDASSDSSDSEDEREKRFTNILRDLIWKSSSIVGELVITNAGMLKDMSRAIDSQMREVAELRKEVNQFRGEKERASSKRSRSGYKEIRPNADTENMERRSSRERNQKVEEQQQLKKTEQERMRPVAREARTWRTNRRQYGDRRF